MLILYIFSFRFVMFIFTRVIIQKAEQKLHQQGSLRICQYIQLKGSNAPSVQGNSDPLDNQQSKGGLEEKQKIKVFHTLPFVQVWQRQLRFFYALCCFLSSHRHYKRPCTQNSIKKYIIVSKFKCTCTVAGGSSFSLIELGSIDMLCLKLATASGTQQDDG